MTEEAKEKIRSISKGDIPIAQRRSLFNHLARHMKNGRNLKPGLVQKYNSCVSSKNERFNLLKEFLIDENMSLSQVSVNVCIMFVQLPIPKYPRQDVEVEAYFVQPKTQLTSLSPRIQIYFQSFPEGGRAKVGGHL